MESENVIKEEVKRNTRNLSKVRHEMPDEIESFFSYLKLARKEGALSRETKELINLAMALVTHCTICVIRHTKMALEMGISREKILETAAVAIGMGGGLAYTQTGYLMETLEAYSEKGGED